MWFKKLRIWYLICINLLRKYYLLVIGSLFTSLMLLYISPLIINLLPQNKQVSKIGIVGIFDQNKIPEYIINQISIGLTTLDDQGNVYPGIASAWHAELGGKVWIYKLDPNLTWTDSTPIKASDIQYKFQDVEVEVIDDYTIKYTLPEVFAPFPSLVSYPLFKTYGDKSIGFGPYKITRITTSAYGSIKEIHSKPVSSNSILPNIEYTFFPTEEDAKTAFKLGKIHSIKEISDPSPFDQWPSVKVTKNLHQDRYASLMFNLNTNNPDLKEKQTRQGLAYAIKDKSFGYPRVISSIPENNWAHNSTVKTYDYDHKRAEEYLDREKNAEPLRFTLSTTSYLLNIAEQIVADWAEYGVEVNIELYNELPEVIDVLLAIREIPQDPDQYSIWHSTQVDQRLAYQNPKIDKLLEDGRKTIDLEERRLIYQDFQRFINEDVPAIFLFHPSSYSIERIK